MKCLDVSKSLFVKMFLSDKAIQEQERQEQKQREMKNKKKKKIKKRKSIFGNKKKSHSTIASSFRSALARLSTTLSKSNPHYVRCIKPNRSEADASAHWDAFDGAEVLSQLLKSGVLETVAIRQRGFPFRMEYSKFRRYLIGRRVLSFVSEKDRLEVLKHVKKDRKWCRFSSFFTFLYRSNAHSTHVHTGSLCLQHSIGPKAEDHAILKRKNYQGTQIPSKRMWIEGKTMMFGKSHLMSELESFVSGKASQVLLKWIRFQVFFRQRLKRFESNGVVMIQKRWRQIRYLRRAMVLIRCCLAKIRMHRLACVCFVQREIRRFRARRNWKEACDLLSLKEKERLRRLEIERREREIERRKKEERGKIGEREKKERGGGED